jgi:hypothetical protein
MREKGKNICPMCGAKMNTKVSFKSKNCPADKRETYLCESCGYATIKETKKEKYIRTKL